ncbi:MAG: glycoside hydrolase family 116 protein, partial [Candidatus Omnitrophica bacterium]|nr:glycoside hydrolase family 116 protein [Candidatus Omnitrophota bacterium]
WFKDSRGEPHQHHYAKKFSSSLKVAQYLLKKRKILENKILKWQNLIYQKKYPIWLKDALINGLYSLAKNTLWVDEEWKRRWYPDKGFFVHSESFSGCPISETMVCRFHGHFPILFFFPDLEYATLYGFKHFQIEDGEIPFCFGLPTSLRDPRYHCQHPLNSSQYVQLVFRYYLQTKDKKFLKDFYSSVKKAINYAKGIDYDNDFLVNEDPHTLPGDIWPANQFYDNWPWYGTSCYVAGIWLASLSSGIEMARIMKDTESEKIWENGYQKGKRSFEKLLWNGKYYNLYTSDKERSEICLANQLMGLWCSSILGLKSPFPKKHIQSALNSIINLNFRKTKWGLVNGMFPNGKKARCRKDESENDHGSQIFFGENICAAMTMIYEGKEKEGLEVIRRLINSYFIKYRTPWNQYCLLSSKDGHPVWGSDYYSNMVIWAVPLALERKNLRNFSFTEKII